jgi:hypothetical protein
MHIVLVRVTDSVHSIKANASNTAICELQHLSHTGKQEENVKILNFQLHLNTAVYLRYVKGYSQPEKRTFQVVSPQIRKAH